MRPFPDSAWGSGAWGVWTRDADGLPAYRLAPPAQHRHTDAWHLVGNDCINATVHAAGHVQLYDWRRGALLVNRWAPERHGYGGGFCYLSAHGDGTGTHAAAATEAEQSRHFGLGYRDCTTTWEGLRCEERVSAEGNEPALRHTVTICNTGDTPERVQLVVVWGADLWPLRDAPVYRMGCERLFDARRARAYRDLMCEAAIVPGAALLHHRWHGGRRPPAHHRAGFDHYPRSVALQAETPEGGTPFVERADVFFAGGGLARPAGVGVEVGLPASWAWRECGGLLAWRYTLDLAPGTARTLRFRYVYDVPTRCERRPSPSLSSGARPVRMRFTVPDTPWLDREAAWHAYYLEAGALECEYFGCRMVDQGSAYGYLQGLSGATRDLALFTLALTYVRPDLAREMLLLSMRAQRVNGKLPYGYTGFGGVGGYGLHSFSSDLDLFFLLAAAEYLGATGDHTLLDEEVLYYPPERGQRGTGLDHLRASFRHLRAGVGLGQHGLLRAGTGDWNDVWLGYSRLPMFTVLRGESALNAAMATVALPMLADVIAARDETFAADLRALAAQQAEALCPLWMGTWMGRGYLGYGDAVLGQDRLFLDAQPWALLGGVWDTTRARALLRHIDAVCCRPQEVGALALWPPMRGPFLEEGVDTNGGTWAAVDSWLAWAWSAYDPAAAWRFFQSTTLAARAQAHPDKWYGIWSGPDSYNAHYHERAGETFDLNATPMARFPVMNMNRHAGPLFNLVRFAGVAPRGGCIEVAPRVPSGRCRLATTLIDVQAAPDRLDVCYRPVADGTVHFAAAPPPEVPAPRLLVEGAQEAFEMRPDGRVLFGVRTQRGRPVHWSLVR